MRGLIVDLGFIQIYWYSVFMLIAIMLGYGIINYESRKYRIPQEFVTNMAFWTIIFGIIGARIYYVLFNLDYYSKNVWDIFKVWEGGLAIHGAIIAGLLVIIFYTKKYKVQTLRMTDIIVVSLILGQAIGRWGNFFNGEAHGPATTLSKLQSLHIPNFIIEGMNINGIYYHPTFLYESLWCIIGLIILIIVKNGKYTKVGQTTAVYLIWYGIGRFLIESLRTDSLMLGSLKIAQLVSISMIIIGIIIFITKRKGSKFDDRYNDTENTSEIRF